MTRVGLQYDHIDLEQLYRPVNLPRWRVVLEYCTILLLDMQAMWYWISRVIIMLLSNKARISLSLGNANLTHFYPQFNKFHSYALQYFSVQISTIVEKFRRTIWHKDFLVAI